MDTSVLKGRIVVGARVKVTHYRPRMNAEPLEAFYGKVVKVRPSGTILVAREDLTDGAGNPIRLEVSNGTIEAASHDAATVRDVALDIVAIIDWRDGIADESRPHFFGSEETQIVSVNVDTDDYRDILIRLDNAQTFRVRVEEIS